jgi:hypothetical protein
MFMKRKRRKKKMLFSNSHSRSTSTEEKNIIGSLNQSGQRGKNDNEGNINEKQISGQDRYGLFTR